MKIQQVTIQGFRGFNDVQRIDFHPSFTLIYAPNSYGKTSISESFEWLLYGVTSKVERADSKEEYKGSYRNRHLPEKSVPFVETIFLVDEKPTKFRVELTNTDEIKRFVDGKPVNSWPLKQDLSIAPRPFILQHALKYLLLVKPDERFQGFAKLLGLEELDQIQRNVVSLCTKPESCIPEDVRKFLAALAILEARLTNQPSLKPIQDIYKRGKAGLAQLNEATFHECKKRVPAGTADESVLPQLLKMREDAITKIFPKRIQLSDYSKEEKEANKIDSDFFLNFASADFIKKYSALISIAAIDHIAKRVQFYGLGKDLLKQTPSKCPFCGQQVDSVLQQHIEQEHGKLERENKQAKILQEQRQSMLRSLEGLKSRINSFQRLHINRVEDLLDLVSSLDKLSAVLVPKNETHFKNVQNTISQLQNAKKKLEVSYGGVVKSLQQVEVSVNDSKEEQKLMIKLGECLVAYVNDAVSYSVTILNNVPPMSDADQILKRELDITAGTEEIGVLIDLLENRKNIQKKFEITEILDSLKDFRKNVDQYVATKVLNTIHDEMSLEVMEWYKQIRTTGDPEVHFTGFDMERTKAGDLKPRRVQINAKSYDKDLVSAVSSLSESKLNALGLCISIATNLKDGCPFDFLIIDDPIQSWDADHEVRFIDVVRKLVQSKKQVILLSHNKPWVDQVRKGCRSLNGLYYEITGYSKAGPHIKLSPWCSWKERLDEVDAIAKDQTANSVRLQQAEGEIRTVVAQVTEELYLRKKGAKKQASKLNSSEVRKALIECGVDINLVDRIVQTFETTDNSHHAPSGYSTHRERIKCYHNWACELANLLNQW